MADFFDQIAQALGSGYARAALIFFFGLVVAYLLRRFLPAGRLHAQHRLVLRRALSYGVLVLAITWALRELGISLGALLGAAGILTVAIGFAAQTSASNLISGLFLMGEQPFVIGDVIRVGDAQGEVISIDLLSVKLRTFDNLLVRIPNETMLKANVTNVTHFPIRRLDTEIGVGYGESIARVKEVLMRVAEQIPTCLEEPRPRLFFRGYGESAQTIQLSVWVARENFLSLRDELLKAVKKAFDEESIEIAYPQRVLHLPERLKVELTAAGGDDAGPRMAKGA